MTTNPVTVNTRPANTRKIAFDVLIRFEKSGTSRLKADSLLAERLAGLEVSAQERGFTYALVMGVLRHWFRLDAWMVQFSGRKLKDLQPAVRVLLRMGLFQLYGLHQVPAYAAINTTVELARTQKQNPKAVQFINAILREGQRRLEADDFAAPSFENDSVQHLLQVYGWPVVFSETLLKTYSSEDVLAMAQAAQNPAPLTIRVNTLKTTIEQMREALEQQGLQAKSVLELPEALLIEDFSGSPQGLPGYEAGWFYVQDPASMQVAHFIAPKADERILDLCSAPGSKTTHLAALMQNTGEIVAVEPKEVRLTLLKENLNRLNVTNVQTVLSDGLQFEPDTLFDRVLVDAPCSGSGTLRRHPEILLQLKKLDLSEAISLQQTLLEKGFACLKPGGVLIYSTCSVLPAENWEVIQAFLGKHSDAILEEERQSQMTPLADGFYMAKLQKK